jgi:hypothetical protein
MARRRRPDQAIWRKAGLAPDAKQTITRDTRSNRAASKAPCRVRSIRILDASWGEHRLQGLQRCGQRHRAQGAHSLDQTRAIERSNLVQQYQALLALESERYPKARRSRSGCHGRHNDSAQVRVHVVGRNHDARPGLLNLAPNRRVKLGQLARTLAINWPECRSDRVDPARIQVANPDSKLSPASPRRLHSHRLLRLRPAAARVHQAA